MCLSQNERIIKTQKLSLKNETCRLHVDKFNSEILEALIRTGLAERLDGHWYNVEKKTANDLDAFRVGRCE